MLTTASQAERGWPSAKEALQWLAVLEPDLAAEARRRLADDQLALWLRLVATGAARELQDDSADASAR